MNSRREFLARFCAITAGLISGAFPALAQPFKFRPRYSCIDQISFSEFAGEVNSQFRVHAAPGRVVQLRLTEASLDPERPQLGTQIPPDANHEKFSLVFTGPRSEPLAETTMKFEHDHLGCFDLLVLPVYARTRDETNYQAVFNRPRKESLA